jgi:hydrocephalus-inducing protein
MEVSYIIKFTPEAKIDYSYDLIAATEREKFIIPIRASGQRTMISFPDTIDFGECMVKHNTEKPVIISNIGEKPTKWAIEVNPPFYTDRTEGFLELG